MKLVHDEFLIFTANVQNQQDNFKRKCNAHDELLRQMQETGDAGYRTEYDPDATVIMSSVPFQQDENIQQKMTELIYDHLQLPREIKIIRCERTPFRNNRPGVIKVEMDSLKSKISVLRNTNKLKTIPGYSRTYIFIIFYHCAALFQILCFYHILNHFIQFRALFIIICRKRGFESTHAL